jgi:hypothetical protein
MDTDNNISDIKSKEDQTENVFTFFSPCSIAVVGPTMSGQFIFLFC